ASSCSFLLLCCPFIKVEWKGDQGQACKIAILIDCVSDIASIADRGVVPSADCRGVQTGQLRKRLNGRTRLSSSYDQKFVRKYLRGFSARTKKVLVLCFEQSFHSVDRNCNIARLTPIF